MKKKTNTSDVSVKKVIKACGECSMNMEGIQGQFVHTYEEGCQMTDLKHALKEKIEEILERDCGLTCPNGAENNKPSLPKILSVMRDYIYTHKIRAEKQCKGNKDCKIHNTFEIGDAILHAHEVGYRKALDDLLKDL